MNPEELFDKIDAYIWDTLSKEERTIFEQELANNDTLRAEFALRQLEYEALRLSSQDDLRAKMKAWKEEAQQEVATPLQGKDTPIIPLSISTDQKGKIIKFQPFRWAAAAAILLCVALFGNYWAKTNYGDAALFGQFNDDTGLSSLRGSGIDTVKSYNDAITLFEKGDFKEAISIFETIDDKILFEKTQFALGESYIRLKDYTNAIKAFQKITTQSTSQTDIQVAEWKLVLTYLVSGQTKGDFEEILSKIATNTNHVSHKKAIDLQQRMGSVWRKVAK
jgi:tetratricopeptide (TPR) repeat protein